MTNHRFDVGGLKIPLAIIEDRVDEEFYVVPEVDLTVNLKESVLMFFPAEEGGKRGTMIIKPRRGVVSAMTKDLDRIERSSASDDNREGSRDDRDPPPKGAPNGG